VRARGFYQLPILQLHDRTLHCAFGKAGFIGQHAEAGFDRLPVLAGGAAGKVEINQEGRRLLIMPDDVPSHPYAVAMESAMLAPKAEVTMFPWKEPKERIPLAVRQVRSFMRAHRPGLT